MGKAAAEAHARVCGGARRWCCAMRPGCACPRRRRVSICWIRPAGCWRRMWRRTAISRRSTGRPGMGSRCGPGSGRLGEAALAGQVRAGEAWHGGEIPAGVRGGDYDWRGGACAGRMRWRWWSTRSKDGARCGPRRGVDWRWRECCAAGERGARRARLLLAPGTRWARRRLPWRRRAGAAELAVRKRPQRWRLWRPAMNWWS